MILDEPMSGLDPIGRREVRDLILELRDAGKTVFFSSHILQDAELICDRVAILDRGHLRSVGQLHEMISQTVRWFEVSVRGRAPGGNAQVERLSSEGQAHLLRVADVAALARLLDRVQSGGGQVLSIWPRKETLEDLFLREIGGEVAGEERT